VRTIEPRRPRPSIEGSLDDGLVVPLVEEPPGVGEYLESLGRSILLADIVTVLAGGALSALLAGMTLRPIRRAVEAEKAFFANAAHDLRTPLAVMRTEAEVALRAGTVGGEEARQLVASSLEEIGHMSAMVEQMLDLARRGRPAGTAELVPMDLAAVARGAVERMARRAADKGVCLTVEAEGEGRIRGDALALQRAVGNVLENALAYTPRGGTVVVRVQRVPGHVVLSVEDSGMGIDPHDLPHIMEPFYRGDRARSVHDGGAGLGLTIVESTMGEHGGTVRAASRAGSGTTITLRFPAWQH
jgi:signal transduction histidine kinase